MLLNRLWQTCSVGRGEDQKIKSCQREGQAYRPMPSSPGGEKPPCGTDGVALSKQGDVATHCTRGGVYFPYHFPPTGSWLCHHLPCSTGAASPCQGRVLVLANLWAAGPGEGNCSGISYRGQKCYPPKTAHLAFMWLFSRVDQVVFLQVGELSEAFVASLTFERPFSTVHSEVDLGRSHMC